MSRLISTPFFSATPVFSRTEYAAAIGRSPGDKVVTAMLAQHLKAGNVRRLARGVFASVPKHVDAGNWSVDRFLAASRLRDGAVIAYHAALELHGYAYTEGREVQVIAPGEPGLLETEDFPCRFVKAPKGFVPADDVTVVDRLGLDVKVTTLERTIADLFDRPDLAGGAEELINSLDLVVRLDAEALARHLAANGNATAAGAAGWWLERRREALRVPEGALEAIHALAPRQTRYALGATAGEGRAAAGWNVVLPAVVANAGFEGV
jgi:predicted transcriptional regulator of viral defense system